MKRFLFFLTILLGTTKSSIAVTLEDYKSAKAEIESLEATAVNDCRRQMAGSLSKTINSDVSYSYHPNNLDFVVEGKHYNGFPDILVEPLFVGEHGRKIHLEIDSKGLGTFHLFSHENNPVLPGNAYLHKSNDINGTLAMLSKRGIFVANEIQYVMSAKIDGEDFVLLPIHNKGQSIEVKLDFKWYGDCIITSIVSGLEKKTQENNRTPNSTETNASWSKMFSQLKNSILPSCLFK